MKAAEPFDATKPDPGALSPSYYKGLACEYFDLDAGAWVTPKGARNEPFDTMVYGIWAAWSPAVKVEVMRDAQWTEKYLAPERLAKFQLLVNCPTRSRRPWFTFRFRTAM